MRKDVDCGLLTRDLSEYRLKSLGVGGARRTDGRLHGRDTPNGSSAHGSTLMLPGLSRLRAVPSVWLVVVQIHRFGCK